MKNKILIIDDSETDFSIMKSLLKQSNKDYTILHNVDGKKVLNQVLNEGVDLVILDLLIDAVDGIDVLRELKENQETENIPVIICSSVGEKETIKNTLDLGADDYFEKPLNDMSIEFGFALKVKNALISKKRSDHVSYLTNHDELTGLWTRKYFELELKRQSDKNAFPISVIILDINGLKVLNDAYGHKFGDKVLKDVAQVLMNLSEKSVCTARWGSDEMVILLPNASKRDIDKVIIGIEQRLNIQEDATYDITFGWAVETRSPQKAKFLVQKAEDKLYSNKVLESRSSRSSMIDTIINTLHQKNPREEMHSHRVSSISEQIAKELGFSSYELKKVKMAGLLHDIGKISIDEAILNKPGRLNKSEWEAITKHPEHGFKILSSSVDTLELAKVVLAHHERWDGGGYPKGIMRDEIPIMARIIAVADTYDAITSKRSYKEAISEEEAIKEIERCSGSQFDPIVVDAFINSLDRVEKKQSSKSRIIESV